MRDYISASQIKTYLTCGQRYMHKYILGIKVPYASGSLIRGNAIDAAANDHFVEKSDESSSKYNIGLGKNDFVDLAVSSHDSIADEEPPENWNKEKYESRDKTARFADLYHGSHGSKLKAKNKDSVQQKILVELSFPETEKYDEKKVNLLGYIDLISDKNVVVDNKVSRSNSFKFLNRNLQMVLYSLATGLKDVAIALIKDVKTPESHYIPTKISNAAISSTSQRVRDVLNGIEKEVFIPAESGSWTCSSKWCEYWYICDYGEKAGKDNI
tara:strand:- start:2511 stop:3320 length:810 start_codon:yes stop_codon:yes gene_type:complete